MFILNHGNVAGWEEGLCRHGRTDYGTGTGTDTFVRKATAHVFPSLSVTQLFINLYI